MNAEQARQKAGPEGQIRRISEGSVWDINKDGIIVDGYGRQFWLSLAAWMELWEVVREGPEKAKQYKNPFKHVMPSDGSLSRRTVQADDGCVICSDETPEDAKHITDRLNATFEAEYERGVVDGKSAGYQPKPCVTPITIDYVRSLCKNECWQVIKDRWNATIEAVSAE